MPSKLATTLKRQGAQPKKRVPLWTGPSGEGPNGGVTQGLIGRFLSCRERFRLHAVEGLRPSPQFEPRMEFGSMWHVCEETLAGSGPRFFQQPSVSAPALTDYCKQLCKKFPTQQEQIDHWYGVCKALFPRYVKHWSRHPDVKGRTPLLQEQAFDVPYNLPSGRTVRLRGKWDAVDLLPAHTEGGRKFAASIWLQENKTKSSIDAVKIGRQVKFDLQTMLYLVALKEYGSPDGAVTLEEHVGAPILGIRYNVIRRSAHKSVESMLKKLDDDVADGRSGEWFARWKIEVTANDIERFRRECLDPILEQLYDWWDYIQCDPCNPWMAEAAGEDVGRFIHWRHPFGIYNVIDEGGFSDVDAFLETGSQAGLHRVDVLYPELA